MEHRQRRRARRGKRVLFDDVTRFDGVNAIGVDEHVWRHTSRGDNYLRSLNGAELVNSQLGRATLHTGAELLTDKQAARIRALFAAEDHVEVEATWGIYQQMIAACRHEDRRHGRELMVKLIASLSSGVPKPLVELTTLGRTLKKRADDVLAYFDRPGTSNGPTEAICECLPGWSGTGWSDGPGRADQRVTLEAIGPLAVLFR